MTDTAMIDRIAVATCVELGIDPTEVVVCGLLDTLTPAERVANRGTGRLVNPSVKAATWQLYRGDVAKMVAVAEALGANIELRQRRLVGVWPSSENPDVSEADESNAKRD